MLERSHIPEARWWIVHAVDQKRALVRARGCSLPAGKGSNDLILAADAQNLAIRGDQYGVA
jgi:hypothetical protein